MKEKRIYEGRFVKRVRIHSRLDPFIYELLEKLMKKYFPCRKKAISLILTKLIIETYLRDITDVNDVEKEKLQKYLKNLESICSERRGQD